MSRGILSIYDTATPLGANQTFTGPTSTSSDYTGVDVSVVSDVDGWVSFDSSMYNIAGPFEYTETLEVKGGVPFTASFRITKHYFRIRYENGNTPQTVFQIQAIVDEESMTAMVNNWPEAMPIEGQIEVLNFPAVQEVSGALTLSELMSQPIPVVGPLTNEELRSGPVFVEGPMTYTEFASAPVAVWGTLTDEQLRATPVSIAGTVSTGGLTNTELRAEAVPVSGTFFPATQPVSGTVSVSNFPATQPVSGTVGVNNFPATQAVSGTVGVNNFPATQAVSGTFWQSTQPVSLASVPTHAVTQSAGPWSVSGPLTDAQLRANPVPVQLSSTMSRVIKTYTASFTSSGTEGMLTITPASDGTAGSNGTSFTVTSGKKLRIQGMTASTRNSGLLGQGFTANLRITNTGSASTSSVIIATVAASSSLALANATGGGQVVFQDGIELSGNMQFGVSAVGTSNSGCTVTVYGYEY